MIDDARFKRNIEWRLRAVAKVPYLVSRYKTYQLNQVAKMVWDRIDGDKSLGAIVDEIASDFDMARDAVAPDIYAFVGEMEKQSMVMRLET